MEVISIMNGIYDSYKDNDYIKAIHEIEGYMNLDGVAIFDNILNIYIICLMRLGFLERACENIDLMRRLFPYYYNYLDLAVKYAKCLRIDKVEEILVSGKIDREDYYDIASACFFNGNYVKAKELFYSCLFNCKDKEKKQQIKKYLKQISLYEKDMGVFREVKYSYFKYMGCKLQPGHVVYVDRLRDEFRENTYNNDPKSIRRPYMIWKIVGSKIYAFPLSTQVKSGGGCIIECKKYPNRDFDRVVKSELVCLEERDISDVIDRIRDIDFNRIINNLYRSICLNHDVPKKTTEYFMNEMVKQFKIDMYDIIVIPDFIANRRRCYLVLDYDVQKQKYKVLEVELKESGTYEVVSRETSTVSSKVSILNVIKLDTNIKNKLVEKVPGNFKKVNMIGKIIEYGSKKLEILVEENDCYICIDVTFGYFPSFINIEIIRNDVPLKIIGELTPDECRNHLYMIKQYLAKNGNDVKRKRSLFKSLKAYMK